MEPEYIGWHIKYVPQPLPLEKKSRRVNIELFNNLFIESIYFIDSLPLRAKVISTHGVLVKFVYAFRED